jgi:O-antigen/teichoic acid export membrane protein
MLKDGIRFFGRFPRLIYALGEASNALNLLLLGFLARYMGVEPFGELVAILAAAGILSELTEFGFPTQVTRSVARDPDHAWGPVRQAMGRQALMSLPMLLFLYGYMRIAHISPSAYLPGMLIGLSLCLRSLKASVRAACRGRGWFGLETLFLWTERASIFLVGLALILWGGRLLALAWVFLAVRALDFIIFIVFVRRLLGPATDGGPETSFSQAIPFAVNSLMWGIYFQADSALLSILSTPKDTGLYGAMARFVDVLLVVPRLVTAVAFPALVAAWAHDRGRFSLLFEKNQRLISFAALPLLLVLILFSETLLSLTFGPDYAVGASALRLVFLSMYFMFHSLLLSQVLISMGREKSLIFVMMGTVLANLILNACLIPYYGFQGAALARLATEIFYLSMLVLLARRVNTAEPGMGLFQTAGALFLGLATMAAHWFFPSVRTTHFFFSR